MRAGLSVLVLVGLSGCAMFDVDPAVPQRHETIVPTDAFGHVSALGFTIDDPAAQAIPASGPQPRMR